MSFKAVSGGGPEAPGPLPWRPDGPPCCQKQKRQCRRPCTKGRSNAFVLLHLIQKHVTRGSVTVVGVLHGSSLFNASSQFMKWIITELPCAVQRRKKGIIFRFGAKNAVLPAQGSPQAVFPLRAGLSLSLLHIWLLQGHFIK